jgi:hypothetical protein
MDIVILARVIRIRVRPQPNDFIFIPRRNSDHLKKIWVLSLHYCGHTSQ